MATTPITKIHAPLISPRPLLSVKPGTHAEILEGILIVGVLGVLVLLFLRLPGLVNQGDGRFAPTLTQQVGPLPRGLVVAICDHFGGHATPQTVTLCPNRSRGLDTPGDNLPVLLEQAAKEIGLAFAKPLAAPLAALKNARQLVEEGIADQDQDLLEKDEEIRSAEAQMQPYTNQYQIADDAVEQGPLPMQCLLGLTNHAWRGTTPAVRAALALWLAAALDGDARSVVLDDTLYLTLDRAWHGPSAQSKREKHAWLSQPTRRACADYSAPDQAAEDLSRVIQLARNNTTEAGKANAIRHVLENVWWHWLVWTALCWIFVAVSRRNPNPVPTTGFAVMSWAALAWWTTVRGWSPGDAPPWLSEWVLLGVGLAGFALWFFTVWIRPAAEIEQPPQGCASPFAYPGFILFAGLGCLLLLDLSAVGHPRNRYLGLYQHDNLFIALFIVSLVSIWRYRLGIFVTRALPLLTITLSSPKSVRPWRKRLAQWGLLVFLVFVLAVSFFALRNLPQVTSELGRVWLILGSAWFFYMRGSEIFNFDYVRNSGWRWFIHFLSPLVFILSILILAMLVTNDMGPLLISVYGGGIFLASAAAFDLSRRGGSPPAVWVETALIVLAWLVLVTGAVMAVGAWHPTTAGRLESMVTPLVAKNDQMALIGWFRHHTPWLGYGVGNVPWCGQTASGACHGVPLQIQSDYVFSAMWGLFGPVMAWVLSFGILGWLYLLARRHPDVTSGKPATIALNDRKVWDIQPFLSWVCVTWLALTACQLAVTIAGNLRVLPLTGVTYPFMSYGMSSLCVNAIFLGLCLNLNLKTFRQP